MNTTKDFKHRLRLQSPEFKEFISTLKENQEKRERQKLDLYTIFLQADENLIFESENSIESKNELLLFSPDIDLVYQKLNLSYLEELGLSLEYLSSSIFKNKVSEKTEFVEFYVDTDHTFIFMVRRHLEHIRIKSEDEKTDLSTFVFLNSRNDLYFYNPLSGCCLLRQYKTDIGISDAKEHLLKKEFIPSAFLESRTYEISGTIPTVLLKKNRACMIKKSDQYKNASMKNIHEIPEHLFNILLESNSVDDSDLIISTSFSGMTKDPIEIQTELSLGKYVVGKISLSEKLKKFSISCELAKVPEKAAKAIFHLSEAEVNKSFFLKESYLKNAVLCNASDIDEKLFSELQGYLAIHYRKNCLNFDSRTFNNSSCHAKILKILRENVEIEKFYCNHPDLKDTFEKIYLERFKIRTTAFPKDFSCIQLEEEKLVFEDNNFSLSSIYLVRYQDSIYAVKIHSNYFAISYRSNNFHILLPGFFLSDLEFEIFRPESEIDLEDFLINQLDSIAGKRIHSYSYCLSNVNMKHSFEINKIFSNFAIEPIPTRKNYDYEISNTSDKYIYDKIISCLQNPSTFTTTLKINSPFKWGSYDEDENEEKQEILLSLNNGTPYASYFDTKTCLVVNSALEPNTTESEYSFSTDEDIFEVQFSETLPFFKTNLHTLISEVDMPGAEAKFIEHSVSLRDYKLWKMCIDFLLKQDES